MKDCCVGKTSKFCPECGQPIPNSALMGLLDHVKRKAKEYQTAKAIRVHESNPSPKRQRYIEKEAAAADKWQSWVDALEKVLDGMTPKVPSEFERLLSVRTRKLLEKMSIFTLSRLESVSEAELLAQANFGPTAVEEVRRVLHENGLKLGGKLP